MGENRGSKHPAVTASSAETKTRAFWFQCPKARECGGCQLAHLPYHVQLQRKQERVQSLLENFCEVEPIIGMDQPLHYRTKVHAVLSVDRKGLPVSGVYAAGTHRVVPVRRCLIEDEQADAIIQTCVELIRKYKVRIWNEYTHRGFLRHIVVRVGAQSGQIMVVLVAAGDRFPNGKEWIQELISAHPNITTVVLNVNSQRTSMVLGKKDIPLYGPGVMEDQLLGRVFRISPQSFYQVNGRQVETLYKTAIDMAQLTGRETLLDAYCGTGTIGLCASDRVRKVIGVELNRDAVADARLNAIRNGIENASFFCEDAGHYMVRQAKEGHVPDVVLMDPPRSGSDAPFLSSLLKLAPSRVVYVSCNPETLARDIAYLADGGYKVERAVPVDMFPGTEHVETVVLMSRKDT